MASKPKLFANEIELCAAFIAALPKEWTAYAETAGWDILLARNTDGFQVGVQAKLKLNSHVVSQALEEWGAFTADRPGPDCRAVLVPSDQSGFETISAYIGFTIIRMTPERVVETWRKKLSADFHPPLPGGHSEDRWHDWMPTKRHQLPDYVPDVAAGASAPIQLTAWKIKALKLLALAEKRGSITRADFKHLGLDHRRWISAGGWLRPGEECGRYTIHNPAPSVFRSQHPVVYEQIKADFDKWAPPTETALHPMVARRG